MAMTSGGCLVFGGLLVMSLGALAPNEFLLVDVIFTIGVIALVAGVAVLITGPRLRTWQFQFLVVLSIAMITVSVHLSGTAATAVSLATLYVFVAFAAFFLSWLESAMCVAVALVSSTTVLTVSPVAPWWSALTAASSTVVLASVIVYFGQLMSSAERDALTGLPNRQGFNRLLAHEVDRAKAGGPRPVVVFVRLALFDGIHDRLGQHAGDQLIRHTVDSWLEALGPDDIVARLGDDEFAVLLPASTEEDGILVGHHLRTVSSTDCAVGVTGWRPGEGGASVLGRADIALWRAARGGPNRTILESAALPTLAAELATAIAGSAVEVLYQPIVSLDYGNRIVGVEALARWDSPTRPDLSISEVISIAENSNLIAALDRFVLRRACMDVQALQQQRTAQLFTLAVNVSGLDLIEKGYVAAVTDILEETGWPPEQLVLEVTESVVDVDTPAAVAVLRELRALGIRIAIDDFGTGYSTLSRLQSLPIDLLKLDASFTARATFDPDSAPPPLLQAIVVLARALDLPVVVEGVETAHQATALGRAGFGLAQGFYFGRPQAPHRLAELLAVG
ncbi:MAG: EAL domain-containing protein [Mycobacterium sp.]